MIEFEWKDGACAECGDVMKVPDISMHIHNECKACQILQKMERIAYALEVKVGLK